MYGHVYIWQFPFCSLTPIPTQNLGGATGTIASNKMTMIAQNPIFVIGKVATIGPKPIFSYENK